MNNNRKKEYIEQIKLMNKKNKDNLIFNTNYLKNNLNQKPPIRHLTNEQQSQLYDRQEKHRNDNIMFFNNILKENREKLILIREQLLSINKKQKTILMNNEEFLIKSYCFIHKDDFVLIDNMLKMIESLIEETKYNYSSFKNKKNIIEIGKTGENLINDYLKVHEYSLTNHSNIIFEINDNGKINTSETDNLVVSTNGIFTIEVKNLGTSGKYQLLIERDGRWIKIFEDGKRQTMSNVTNQTYRHIAFNEKIINENLKKYGIEKFINIYPLIVIANQEVDIINYSNLPIVRPSNMYHEITMKNDNLSTFEIECINKIINENKKNDLNFPMPQYYDLFLHQIKLLINVNKILSLMLDTNKEVILNIDEINKITQLNMVKGKREYFYEIYKKHERDNIYEI